MSTECTGDHNKCLWGANVLEHQQLHRNQWAPPNPSTWHQIELIFFCRVPLGALWAEQHTPAGSSWIWCCDVLKWKSVMEWCRSWKGHKEVPMLKWNIKNALNLHPSSWVLESIAGVIIWAQIFPPYHRLPPIVPQNRGHSPITLLLIW